MTSASKTGVFGSVVDMGKNNKNLKTIMDELSMELKKYPKISKISPEPVKVTSIADEIRKLADLKKEGILTEEEFNAKKKQLLNL